jgi:hypothetical protein
VVASSVSTGGNFGSWISSGGESLVNATSYTPSGASAAGLNGLGDAPATIPNEVIGGSGLANRVVAGTEEGAPILTAEKVDLVVTSTTQEWQFEPTLLWNELREFEDQIEAATAKGPDTVLIGAGLSLVALAGFVVCNPRCSYLIGSAAAGAPLWRQTARDLDPLVILENWDLEYAKGRDPESLQALVA